VRNEFKLVDTDKPAETASDFYRFQVKVAPGKTETLTVTEEQVLNQTVTLASSADEQLRFFMNQTVVSKKVKDGLQKAIDLRWATAKTQREIAELAKQLKVIVDDQVRLRANLKEMPATADAYKRYLKKFDDQETQIEDFQARIKKLQDTEHEQQKEFDDFLAGFSAE
jgi:septal ring factor EnvC (AmiA/AmiB activator)